MTRLIWPFKPKSRSHSLAQPVSPSAEMPTSVTTQDDVYSMIEYPSYQNDQRDGRISLHPAILHDLFYQPTDVNHELSKRSFRILNSGSASDSVDDTEDGTMVTPTCPTYNECPSNTVNTDPIRIPVNTSPTRLPVDSTPTRLPVDASPSNTNTPQTMITPNSIVKTRIPSSQRVTPHTIKRQTPTVLPPIPLTNALLASERIVRLIKGSPSPAPRVNRLILLPQLTLSPLRILLPWKQSPSPVKRIALDVGNVRAVSLRKKGKVIHASGVQDANLTDQVSVSSFQASSHHSVNASMVNPLPPNPLSPTPNTPSPTPNPPCPTAPTVKLPVHAPKRSSQYRPLVLPMLVKERESFSKGQQVQVKLVKMTEKKKKKKVRFDMTGIERPFAGEQACQRYD
ncbi:hypothetical protein M231_04057 [Tremella mesenterica]|uniref:Uncharacterized protein n=1 Tax=Tremella mesenterica TaxID=5217 RepID=A0A4Q1BLT4_TREME|nr:hypothetical protein M231_04057 [Tremella mesenterica]